VRAPHLTTFVARPIGGGKGMANQTDEARDAEAGRECPYCKETINASANKCRYCLSSIDPEHPDHGGTCPFCKESIDPDALKCPHCQSVVAVSRLTRLRTEGGGGPLPCGPGGSGKACSECIDGCWDENLGDYAAIQRCIKSRCGGTVTDSSLLLQLVLLANDLIRQNASLRGAASAQAAGRRAAVRPCEQ
jgi:hypothetical protein